MLLQGAAICPGTKKIMGGFYMSDWQDYDPLQDGELEDEDESLFDSFELDIACHMDDPPAEAYEMSWLRARAILEDAGPDAAILLLTITVDPEGDLASSVVLSSGYQRIPTQAIFGILDTHLGAMGGESDSQDAF